MNSVSVEKSKVSLCPNSKFVFILLFKVHICIFISSFLASALLCLLWGSHNRIYHLNFLYSVGKSYLIFSFGVSFYETNFQTTPNVYSFKVHFKGRMEIIPLGIVKLSCFFEHENIAHFKVSMPNRNLCRIFTDLCHL